MSIRLALIALAALCLSGSAVANPFGSKFAGDVSGVPGAALTPVWGQNCLCEGSRAVMRHAGTCTAAAPVCQHALPSALSPME